MKISNITLHNFRIYKGTNSISFLPFTDRNVSIIAGKNGFGKTTFLTSLIWVFYGKLMTQVESKYKKDIKNSGGYIPFLDSLLNRDVKSNRSEDEKSFFIEVELKDLMIPAMPCESIVVRRSYDYSLKEERLSILIDGIENELTKDVGYELFINDFILPREIAKFFFFDAEKIVSLAEAKSKDELRSLSRAYSEVLGIKKYEELKKNLESLLSKLLRNGVSKSQKRELEKLISKEDDSSKLLAYNSEQQEELKIEINNYSLKSSQLQEKLIREGNAITLEELLDLKSERDRLKKESQSIKSNLLDLLELAPLIIAGKKLSELKEQLDKESNKTIASTEAIKNEIEIFSKQLVTKFTKAKIGSKTTIQKIVNELIKEKFNTNNENEVEILNSFSLEQYRNFNAIYSSIKGAYVSQLSSIVQQEKNNRVLLFRTLNKIKQAEARKGNHLAKKLREEKGLIDSKIEEFKSKLNELLIEQGNLEAQNNSDKRILSEYEKNFKLLETDKKKYVATEVLLTKITTLIKRIKEDKKYTLQKALKISLDKLMHKDDFISNVNIIINEDIMDIELLDSDGVSIEKDSLSKGEQQLYATALLKALVDESGIKFPIFIDSPLQKFDKYHSKNIIEQFYPSISDQVVLFPLLEKELTLKEYELLEPNMDKTFTIETSFDGTCSSILKTDIKELFNKSKSEAYV